MKIISIRIRDPAKIEIAAKMISLYRYLLNKSLEARLKHNIVDKDKIKEYAIRNSDPIISPNLIENAVNDSLYMNKFIAKSQKNQYYKLTSKHNIEKTLHKFDIDIYKINRMIIKQCSNGYFIYLYYNNNIKHNVMKYITKEKVSNEKD